VFAHYDSITDDNPDCTSFTLTVTGGVGSDSLDNDDDTTTPGPMEFAGLTLTGGTKLTCTVTHYDKSGQSGDNVSSEYFVKPYQPQAPTVVQVGGNWSVLDVTVNKDVGGFENDSVVYAIYCSTLSLYVKADGSLGASPVWDTVAGWGTVRVTGLSGETSYNFETRSHNFYTEAALSEWSTSGSDTTAIEPPEAPTSPGPPDGATGVPVE
jgi:hypothetical protein